MCGSDEADVRAEGAGPGIVELPEATAGGIGPHMRRRVCVPHEGELPARLRAGPDCGRVSRGDLVPLRHAAGVGEDYPGAPD